MPTSTTQTTTTQNSKDTSSESAPSSQTEKPTTPIDQDEDLYTKCELCKFGQFRGKTCIACEGLGFAITGLKTKQVERIIEQHQNRDLEIEAKPKNNGWISVDNELPDADITFLTFNQHRESYEMAYYCDIDHVWWTEGGDEFDVTHWQELTIPNQ